MPLREASRAWRPEKDGYKIVVPEGIKVVKMFLLGGAGDRERPGVTWLDDLKVYVNGKLVYLNDFSNWSPYIGAGVGATAGGLVAYLPTRKIEYGAAGAAIAGIVGAIVGWLLGGQQT